MFVDTSVSLVFLSSQSSTEHTFRQSSTPYVDIVWIKCSYFGLVVSSFSSQLSVPYDYQVPNCLVAQLYSALFVMLGIMV